MPYLKTEPTNISAREFSTKAVAVASYYGFVAKEKVFSKNRKIKTKIKNPDILLKKTDLFSNELGEIVKMYVSRHSIPLSEPAFIYHNSATSKIVRFGLTIIGIEKSIAEALILKTALAILGDVGFKEISVHINSMGDKNSATAFTRELHAYLRKRAVDMPVNVREALKRNIFYAFELLRKKHNPIHEDIPRSMEFLSDSGRKHFREVLEYLEAVDIPYEINSKLIGHKDCYSQTLFEIRNNLNSEQSNDKVVLAYGGRCDEIAQQLFRLPVPAVGILFEWTPTDARDTPLKIKSVTHRPKVYLVQIGFKARFHSLAIIETLRKARVPFQQSINSELLTSQLETATMLKIPYAIILGQREVLDKTVIIRNMHSQSQETIPIDTLSEYVRTLGAKK